MIHSNLSVGEIHQVFNWVTVDTTSRDALVIDADSIYKSCFVTDILTAFVLIDLTPTWVATGGAIALGDLSDVDLTGLVDGQAIIYDSGSGDWIPGTAGGDHLVEDAVTAAVTNVVALQHNSTGTPAAGFGTGLDVQAETDTTPDTQIGSLTWSWDVTTHASRRSSFIASQVIGGVTVETAVLQSHTSTLAGLARGLGAVDIQMSRTANTQIASGASSTVIGGAQNSALANFTTVIGGIGNTNDAAYSSILGGYKNTINTGGLFNVIGSGNYNSTDGSHTFIGTGEFNAVFSGSFYTLIGNGINNATLAGSFYSSILNGSANTMNGGKYHSILGGSGNTITNGSANYGFIGGGDTNTISSSGSHNSIIGGLNGVISGTGSYNLIGNGSGNTIATGTDFTFIGSGQTNTIGTSSDHSVIAGGYTNTINNSGILNFIGGGVLHSIGGTGSSTHSVIAGGNTNLIDGGVASSIGGGDNNTTKKSYSTIPGGRFANTENYAQVAAASGRFTSDGDAQGTIQMVSRTEETHSDATWRELFLDGSTERIGLSVDQLLTFDILIIGSTAGATDNFSYRIEGACKNDGGTSTLLASTRATIFETTATFDARVTVDDATDTLRIEVQDSAGGGDLVRWVSTLRTAELIYS